MTIKINRRSFVSGAAKLGGAAAVLPLLLAEIAEAKDGLSKGDVAAAAAAAGLSFDDKQQEMMLEDLQDNLKAYSQIHEMKISNSVAPALDFNPVLPGMKFETTKRPLRMSGAGSMQAPKDIEDVAFYSVRDLGELIRRKKISSLDLTQMYLARLKKYDPLLHFVVTLTEERALA